MAPGWVVWSTFDAASRVDLWSTAVRTSAGWLVVDPIELSADAFEEALGDEPVALLVLTNGNHARAAAAWRKRLGVPLAAHPEAAREAGVRIDVELSAESAPAPGVRVVALPGAGAGEIALLCANGVCVVGDILINLPSFPFQILPDKYCADARQAVASLRALATEPGWDEIGRAHV